MLESFLNPALLLGLAGLGLPVMAHLLSKRKYDVIEWGAMQFLELGQNTRRKLRLEELLLMLLRMGLIALVVFALSRPWVSSGVLGQIASGQSRDVVLVIDGSYSMGWEGLGETPHDRARRLARLFLQELNPGDTVQVIDARDQPRLLLDAPTRDFRLVREAIDAMPPPSGSSHLPEAITAALKNLTATENLAREVVVFSDQQQLPWKPEETTLWARIDGRVEEASLQPKLWAIHVGAKDVAKQPNFWVDEIRLSREVTVPDFPVTLRTTINASGGEGSSTRNVHLEIDGQRIGSRRQVVPVEANGSATVEFEYRFNSPGSHHVAITLDDDSLPGDNSAAAAILVQPPVPVLLIDGDPQEDPAKRETRFLKDALSPSLNPNPWVQAIELSIDDWSPEDLSSVDVVVLANVARLTDEQQNALTDFVSRGGGLFFTLGDQIDAESWSESLWNNGRGLLSARPTELASPPPAEEEGDDPAMQVGNDSLDLDWMKRFRLEENGGLVEARFNRWWNVELPPKQKVAALDEEGSEDDTDSELPISDALVAARFANGDPLLISRRYGRGMTALFTSTADADWNTLVSKHDYVALMHEVVFRLSAAGENRNVAVGVPLVLPIESTTPEGKPMWMTPAGDEVEPVIGGDEIAPLAILESTPLAGVYTYAATEEGATSSKEYFVTSSGRDESNLTPLNASEAEFLTENDRLTIIESEEPLESLTEQMFADDSKTEIWHILLLIFLGFLVFELWMTRRLVKGGHARSDATGSNDDDSPILLTPEVQATPRPARRRPSSGTQSDRRPRPAPVPVQKTRKR